MFFQGHFADPPPMPQRTRQNHSLRKAHYLAFIEKKKVVTHWILQGNSYDYSDSPYSLVELEKQGQEKTSVHDKIYFYMSKESNFFDMTIFSC